MNPNINRKLPPYMPTKEALLLIWIEQFLNALKPMLGLFQIEQQDYDIYVEDFAANQDAYNCHIHSEGVSRGNTRHKDLGFYDRNQLTATAPRSEENIFPSTSSLKGGYLWRLVDLINTQILSNPNCTEDIKRQLGILPPVKSEVNLHAQSFIIEGDQLLDGIPNVTWTKGKNSAATFQYREQGEDDTHWHGAGTYASSPSPLAIPQLDKARVVEVIGRYVKGNQQVGEWSSIYLLTIPAAKA